MEESTLRLRGGGDILADRLQEAPPHVQLDCIAVQPAEDARADVNDKEDLELLQVRIAVDGPGLDLLLGR
jgi:hypothetical protein